MTRSELNRRRALLEPYRNAQRSARRAVENRERCGCGAVEMCSPENLAEIDRDVARQEEFVLEALVEWWAQDCKEKCGPDCSEAECGGEYDAGEVDRG